MQINHFVKELQKCNKFLSFLTVGFETQTKKRLENRNNQDTHDNQDTEYTEDIKASQCLKVHVIDITLLDSYTQITLHVLLSAITKRRV